MIRIDDKITCTGCHACATVCPKACITMEADREGFLYPRVDPDACIRCGRCLRACPLRTSDSAETAGSPPLAYGAYALEEAVRLSGSSGGLFTVIAQAVLDEGGVVFGAAFDPTLSVVHAYAEDEEGLARFQGSKYVQSVIGSAYGDAKRFLDAGRTVLFTGTPCQIGGLLQFLGKPYERLITVDFICHGVPSPMVWDAYLTRRGIRREAITAVSFRDKRQGWRSFSMTMEGKEGVLYTQPHGRDPYMQAFLKNYSLRPSCYACAFKGTHRASDLTMADFWGVERVAPELFDERGVSLLAVHTPRGQALLERISPRIKRERVSLEEAIGGNDAMVASAKAPQERDAFLHTVQAKGFRAAYRRYLRPSVGERWRKKLRRVLKRLKR